jgi:Domain of unknown function (DUF4432)
MSGRALVDTSLVADGVPGIAITGEGLRLTLFPEAGAKIRDLVHIPTGENLLWRNPRVPLRPTYAGAAFDDVWCGGWDELFPTDAPCEVGQDTFHDHGDLWFAPWEWRVEEDDGETATVGLRAYAVSMPCLMERWISVRRDSLEIRFRHRLTNLGARPVQFFWNLHVAHAIDPSSRIGLPVDKMHTVEGWAERFRGDLLVGWPDHGETDMRAVPAPEAGLTEWLYTPDGSAGWCEVTHPARGVGLRLDYDPSVFRTTWLWGVYGGWRGHYVLLTEPGTSPPGGLAVNVADGTAAELGAGAVIETTVTATVLDAVR